MKYLQTVILKIIILSLFSFSVYSQSPQQKLKEADSLFQKKQYTQSIKIYQQLLNDRHYSPAMLLKMAYIQEGLNQTGYSLYYLQLYYNQTGDTEALAKMQELATKFNLEGYSDQEPFSFPIYIAKHATFWLPILASVCVFLLAVMVYLKRKKKNVAVAASFLMVLLASMAAINWVEVNQSAIIKDQSTYLMTGPSAGASVVKIVGEGHKVKVMGEKDIWLRVQWGDQEVYVKKQAVIPVSI